MKKTPRTDSLEQEVIKLKEQITELDEMFGYTNYRIDELISNLKEATQYLDAD